MLKKNHFVLKLCLGTTGSVLISQDEMAQTWLQMGVFDPGFGHREPPMPCFGTPNWGKLPFDMGIMPILQSMPILHRFDVRLNVERE